MRKQKITRRKFLAGVSLAAAAPWLAPARAGPRRPAGPSSRITLATIGLGGRNTSNLEPLLKQDDVQCLAICDCFADRRGRARKWSIAPMATAIAGPRISARK